MLKKEYKPGVHQISNAEYHSSSGLSRTQLWKFRQLPYKYWYEYLSGEHKEKEDKDAFVMGSLVHTLILEPHLYEEQFYILPECDRRTKEGKAIYADALLQSEGKTLISKEQFYIADGMRESVSRCKVSMQIICEADIEHSIYWTHAPTGLQCKVRPDIWKHPLMADLKTTTDASYRGFQQSAYKHGYFLQAAMMYEAAKSIGMPFDQFPFITVENKKPFAVAIYRLDEAALQFGLDMYNDIMYSYAKCLEKNEWPGYGIQTLCVPKYATMELSYE